jgi:hypothetical protein
MPSNGKRQRGGSLNLISFDYQLNNVIADARTERIQQERRPRNDSSIRSTRCVLAKLCEKLVRLFTAIAIELDPNCAAAGCDFMRATASSICSLAPMRKPLASTVRSARAIALALVAASKTGASGPE